MRVRSSIVVALCVVTGLALLPSVSASAATPHLKGRVTNAAGNGVAGVCVDIHPSDNLAAQATYTTGANGRWTASPSGDEPAIFGGGTYRVKVEYRDCDGLDNGNVAGGWHAGARTFDTATVVTVNPAAGSPVDLRTERLAAGGAVSGRVVDDAGAGLGRACVSVSDPVDASVGNDTVATAQGSFTVVGLPAGTYVVKAADCRATRTQASAWLGPDGTVARGAGDALHLRVAAGGTERVGALTLPDAGRITGAIRAPGADAGACVTAIDLDSNTSVGDTTNAAGQYTLPGLLPGRWLVRVSDCRDGIGPAARFATVYLLPGSDPTPDPSLAEANPSTVGSGSTDAGVRTMAAGGALSGRVFTDAATDGVRSGSKGAPVAGACVSATPRGSLRIVASVQTTSGGDFVLGGLHPDAAYRFAAYDCDASNVHGLDWAASGRSAPAEGQADAFAPVAGQQRGGIEIVVGDVVRRVAGDTRIHTAAELALGTFADAATVVLARADDYPDALAGAPLAALLDAPILLTDKDALSSTTAAAIEALGAEKVVLLGLEAALSARVQAQVDALDGVQTVQRLGGGTRFDTAALIANAVGGDHAYVVEGDSPDRTRGWPDAVSVAGLAARTQAPLLLVQRDRVPEATATALRGLGFDSLTAIGGPVAISEAVYAQLDAQTGSVERLAGGTRYGTSAAVVQRALELGMWSRTTWVATGLNYPDALVAGAVVGQDGGILQLVHGQDPAGSPEALDTLDRLSDGVDRVVFLGGRVAISDATAAAVGALVGTG